jgi:hypothetical protein
VNARVPGPDADAGHLHPVTTANAPGLQRGRLPWASMEDDMPSTLIPACVLCRLRFASRLLPGLHIREDHPRRNRHAEPGHDHSGDRDGPAGETGSAAGGGPDAQAARVPGISPNTARAAPADGPPRDVRRPAGSAADEVEPRVWPYQLPAGWRRVTETGHHVGTASRNAQGRRRKALKVTPFPQDSGRVTRGNGQLPLIAVTGNRRSTSNLSMSGAVRLRGYRGRPGALHRGLAHRLGQATGRRAAGP